MVRPCVLRGRTATPLRTRPAAAALRTPRETASRALDKLEL